MELRVPEHLVATLVEILVANRCNAIMVDLDPNPVLEAFEGVPKPGDGIDPALEDAGGGASA